MTEYLRPAYRSEITFYGFLTSFAEIKSAWTAWRKYRETLNVLNSLTDANLYDIGLSRGDIRPAAYKAAYGKNVKPS